MNEFLKEIAEDVGASDFDKFISFLCLRGQGDTRKEVAQKIKVSPRTLYNWNKEIMEIPREKRLKLLVLAIIEHEDLDLEVVD